MPFTWLAVASSQLVNAGTMLGHSSCMSCCISQYISLRFATSVTPRASTTSLSNRSLDQKLSFHAPPEMYAMLSIMLAVGRPYHDEPDHGSFIHVALQ